MIAKLGFKYCLRAGQGGIQAGFEMRNLWSCQAFLKVMAGERFLSWRLPLSEWLAGVTGGYGRLKTRAGGNYNSRLFSGGDWLNRFRVVV